MEGVWIVETDRLSHRGEDVLLEQEYYLRNYLTGRILTSCSEKENEMCLKEYNPLLKESQSARFLGIMNSDSKHLEDSGFYKLQLMKEQYWMNVAANY